MGNRNGGEAKVPMSKMKDDAGELELEPPLLSSSASRQQKARKVPPQYRDYQDYIVSEVVRGHLDREEGLGQLAILPDECILHVLSFLGLADVGSASCASRALFVLGRDDALWKLFYRRGLRRVFLELGISSTSTTTAGRGGGNHEGGSHRQRAGSASSSSISFNPVDDQSYSFAKDAKARQKRKERRCGKWKMACRLNFVRLPLASRLSGVGLGGEGVILTEQLLGWSIDKINELLGTCDEITPVGRNGAYYYYHTPGLAICFEDERVTAILKNIPLESCTGPAYAKIVPRR